jgi:hypothetical protein
MENTKLNAIGKFIVNEFDSEMQSIFKIEDLLQTKHVSNTSLFYDLANLITTSHQNSHLCSVRIRVYENIFLSENFYEHDWRFFSKINLKGRSIGIVECFIDYSFNPSEQIIDLKKKYINSITERLTKRIADAEINQSNSGEIFFAPNDGPIRNEWYVMLDMIRRTDHLMFSILSRKMINYLFFKGIAESRELFEKLGTTDDMESSMTEINRPLKKQALENTYYLGIQTYMIASNYLSDEEILNFIYKWIMEDKSNFLVKALANPNTPLFEIVDAIRRFYLINPAISDLTSPITKGILVSLIRRFLSDQIEFINIAKKYLHIHDFYDLLRNMIYPAESHGKIGGKGSGLFLAYIILQKAVKDYPELQGIRVPKTWYITSDAIVNFIYANNLEEVIEQKYKDIDEIRTEYPHVVQAFKNSQFPKEVANGLASALDDFGDNPIIVRSSSLLEDRLGSVFAGKYKSLFLANQGSKKQRLDALIDAVAEVYASTFGPDPLGYRAERGLLDFNEEMGILIQEVIGKRCGKYFLPAFAGVAFCNNEFRWSPRIKREDGLIRMVPGLGTRAVDRIGDDYPILIAPGQPDLRVNLTTDEMINYSPKHIDVINLETNSFETILITQLIEDIGNQYPAINQVFSIRDEHHLKKPVGLGIDTKKHDIVVTFENLISNTNYIQQLKTILNILKDKLETPVDIEFVSDGEALYLLQCRPQSYFSESASAVIPKDISPEKIIFTANQFVSNGRVPDISYIVYVDPTAYSKLINFNELKEIGRSIGKINQVLPRKSFILIGPGRWGSRDDINLGVSVRYSDINNTAMLIEVARQKGKYVPELSFGTHFFQDLVEASIRYLPLYPDNKDVIFNEEFLKNSKNSLPELLPQYSYIADIVRVIDVKQVTNGKLLRVLMNSDEDEAIAYLTEPKSKLS